MIRITRNVPVLLIGISVLCVSQVSFGRTLFKSDAGVTIAAELATHVEKVKHQANNAPNEKTLVLSKREVGLNFGLLAFSGCVLTKMVVDESETVGFKERISYWGICRRQVQESIFYIFESKDDEYTQLNAFGKK